MGHDHRSSADQHRGALAVTLVLSTAVLIAQVAGALVSDSLALLADAGHSLSDVVGVAAALIAIAWARRPAPAHRTFGRYRVEVLAAAVNGLLLLGIAAYVLIEVGSRWGDPSPVAAGPMIIVAAASILANAVGVILLRRGAKESITIRGAYLEVLGDMLGSIAVLAAGAVIALTGFVRADAIASVLIAAFIVPRAIRLLAEAWSVFAEGAPRGISIDEVRQHMSSVPGVVEVHDLHLWTITSGMPVVSAHVVVTEEALAEGHGAAVLERLQECLGDCFAVTHCTFQIEPPGFPEAEGHA